MQRIYMKRFVKISAVSAVILGLTVLGVSNAQAGGWPIAAGIASGVAAGAIVGTVVAAAVAQPVYYGYPAPAYTYAAPAYPAPAYAAAVPQPPIQGYAPAPATVVVPAAPVYYYPRVYPYYYPWVRGGAYWGRPYYGYRAYRRW
jgi:hypothetical protein